MTDKNRRIEIMGIVNVTDDSYFASSRCLSGDGKPDMGKILERTGRMLEEGADIIDIGACSTRPGSEPVGDCTEGGTETFSRNQDFHRHILEFRGRESVRPHRPVHCQ